MYYRKVMFLNLFKRFILVLESFNKFNDFYYELNINKCLLIFKYVCGKNSVGVMINEEVWDIIIVLSWSLSFLEFLEREIIFGKVGW